jgi:hypothetical protein
MSGRISSTVLLPLALMACHSGPPSQIAAAPYLVTVNPIDVGDGIKLCVAVDPTNEHGIWWWGPGRTGCATRSTGPGLFHPDDARVVRAATAGAVTCEFRLGTHSLERPFIDVRLVVEDGTMRSEGSSVRVALQQRTNLDVPELPPFGYGGWSRLSFSPRQA